MTDTPEKPEDQAPAKMKKACQIMIMFGVEDDADALAIKAEIDPIVARLLKKQYNFSISEV